jgi:hypothetical protein
VGGIIGTLAVVVITALLFYFLRRRNTGQKDHALDLINAEDDDEDLPAEPNVPGSRASQNDLPEFYRPQPYLVSESDTGSMTGGRRTPGWNSRRISAVSSQPDTMSQLGQLGHTLGDPSMTSSSGRKGLPPRQFRAVNIIQHEDAGPDGPPADGEGQETIELPPAYTNIKGSSSERSSGLA